MKSFNKNECQFIQDRACERISEIFDALNIEYTARHDYIQCACPIHEGDNQRALYWAMQTCHWKCVTKHCEQNPVTGPSSSVFGLVRGVLSSKTQEQCSFQQAIAFVAQVLNLSNVQMDEDTAEKIEIAKTIKAYKKRAAQKASNKGMLLSAVLPSLIPDTVYYPTRGISTETISRYHISFCDDDSRPFCNRAFFPILDETGRYVLGWSARSIFDKCFDCNMFHPKDTKCPIKDDWTKYAKWRHSSGFKTSECLYNLWYAKPFIGKYGSAIVCEGPGDIWALEQSGIRNSVAMFGLSCSKKQRKLLQQAGALTLVFILDNDESAREATDRLKDQLMHYFRMFFITPENASDVGEMMHDDIKASILPFMKKISMHKVLMDE